MCQIVRNIPCSDYVLLLAILATTCPPLQGANVLGIFTSHSPSHLVIHMAMARTLAEQGHNVTVVSSMKSHETVPSNVTHILIEPSELHKQKFKRSIEVLLSRTASKWDSFKNIQVVVDSQYELILDPRFTALYESQFDLVIVGYFMNVYQLGVAAKFNCPLIVSWVGGPIDMADYLSGNPSEISYVPTLYMAPKHNEIWNFNKRLQNFMAHMWTRFVVAILEYRMENFYNLAFANEIDFPSYDEMKRRISLVFSNYHAISEGPIRPIVPSYIEVGGLQIKEDPDPLPKDISNFLDNAKEGAIIFSLGSNVKGAMLKPEVVKALFNVLSSLKQHVLWKWEDLNNLPGNASNILFRQWIPQGDALAHPNTKLFITHAGKGGSAEAQYRAVPILALPVFGDQFGLAESLVHSGFGLSLNLLNLTETDFKAAVTEILDNPVYANNVRRFSNFYRDRPLSAKQSFIYWTEYVLRHKGALHMQTPVIHMNVIARNNLDIYAVILAALFVVLIMIKRVLKLLHEQLFANRIQKRKVKNN